MNSVQNFISNLYTNKKSKDNELNEEGVLVDSGQTKVQQSAQIQEASNSFDWKSIFRSPPTTGINSGEATCDYFSSSDILNFETGRQYRSGRRYSMGSYPTRKKRSPSIISLTTTSNPNSISSFNFNTYSFVDEPDEDSLLYTGMDMYAEGLPFSNQAKSSENFTNLAPPASPPNRRSKTEPSFRTNDFDLERGYQLESPSVKLIGRTTNEMVITQNMADKINEKLPPIMRLAKSWTLSYSIDQHGLSISTLFRNCKSHDACILAIKDSNEQVFGAFLSDSIHPNPNYYGTGECFLWRFGNPREIAPTTDDSPLFVFDWTGNNHYTILCEPTYISVGGGDGKYGLWIDSELNLGISSKCSTFNNLPLSGPQEEFYCVQLEVWGIDA